MLAEQKEVSSHIFSLRQVNKQNLKIYINRAPWWIRKYFSREIKYRLCDVSSSFKYLYLFIKALIDRVIGVRNRVEHNYFCRDLNLAI